MTPETAAWMYVVIDARPSGPGASPGPDAVRPLLGRAPPREELRVPQRARPDDRPPAVVDLLDGHVRGREVVLVRVELQRADERRLDRVRLQPAADLRVVGRLRALDAGGEGLPRRPGGGGLRVEDRVGDLR